MRSIEADYNDPHHIGKDDADYVIGFEPTMFDKKYVSEDADGLVTIEMPCCGQKVTRSAVEEANGCPVCDG